MKRLIILLTFSTAMLLAQPPSGATPQVTDIKAYLALSDSQIQSIEKIMSDLRTSEQTTQQTLRTQQKALGDAIAAGSTDATALGKLLLAAETTKKQLKTASDTAHAAAVATLTADQKTKLQALVTAASLRSTIQEATMLNLIEPATAAGPGVGGGPAGRGGQGPGPNFRARRMPGPPPAQ